jgi:hypothetical protein
LAIQGIDEADIEKLEMAAEMMSEANQLTNQALVLLEEFK